MQAKETKEIKNAKEAKDAKDAKDAKELFSLRKGNNEFENIFKDMLDIEDAKSFESRVNAKRAPVKNQSANVIFRHFITAFLTFSAIFILIEIILFFITDKFTKLPGYPMLEIFLRNMLPGFFNYFNADKQIAAPFFLFTVISISLCLVFGLGVFTGYAFFFKARNLRAIDANKLI